MLTRCTPTAPPRARRRRANVLGLALAAALLVGAGPCEVAPGTGKHLLVLRGVRPADLEARLAALGGHVVREYPALDVVLAGGLSSADVAQVEAWPEVAEVNADRSLRLVPDGGGGGWQVLEESAPAAPAGHDPTQALFFGDQWNLRAVRADAAWAAGFRGDSSVSVAIVDTGIDPDHADLAGRVDAQRSAAFVPSLGGPPLWSDDNFHGTLVAGIVTSNGLGVAGVAPHATLVAVKVCDVAGRCDFSDVLAGVLHAADAGVDVINLSLTGSFARPGLGRLVALLNRAVAYAERRGALVVAAAGNQGADLQHQGPTLLWPCEGAGVACVAATGPDDAPAAYSNFGTSSIDLAAPGGELGADPLRSLVLGPCSNRSLVFPSCRGRNLYLLGEGTSFAAPHVAGAAALLQAQQPRRFTPGRLRARLRASAVDLGDPGADPFYGHGRLDVCRALGC